MSVEYTYSLRISWYHKYRRTLVVSDMGLSFIAIISALWVFQILTSEYYRIPSYQQGLISDKDIVYGIDNTYSHSFCELYLSMALLQSTFAKPI